MSTTCPTLVIEEAVGRLGIRPILTGQRDALGRAVDKLLQHERPSRRPSRFIGKSAAGQFLLDHVVGRALIGLGQSRRLGGRHADSVT